MSLKKKTMLACVGALIAAATAAPAAEVTGKALIFDLSVGTTGKTASVSSAGSVVNLSLYAYVLDADNNPDNTGFDAAQLGILSGNGGLKGDLANMSLSAPFNAASPASSPGNNVDLDGDGDKDLGALPTATSGHVTPSSGNSAAFSPSTTVVNPLLGDDTYTGTYSRFLLGTLTFTVTDLTSGSSTLLTLQPRTGAGVVNPQKITLDSTSVLTSMKGTDSRIAVADGVLVSAPEPASLSLIGLGGLGLLARRRRQLV